MTNTEARTILLYGETGSTKTTQLALKAEDIYKKTGKITRLIQCDGGGSKQFDDLGLIEAGIVQRFTMPSTEAKIANLFRLSKGYWPRVVKGELKFYHSSEYMTTPEEFEQIGAYMFDSLTGMAEILSEHVSDPARSIGFKLGTKSSEDGYDFGTLDMGHYGIIQKELRKAFEFGFNYLPVDFVMVTARVAKGESKNRTSTYGPATSGNAITSDIPSWFNDCYFLESKTVKIENEIVNAKVAWFEEHRDENTSIPYPAKIRCVPQVYTKLKDKNNYPDGYTILYPEDGLIEFLDNLDKLNKSIKKITSIHDASKVS